LVLEKICLADIIETDVCTRPFSLNSRKVDEMLMSRTLMPPQGDLVDLDLLEGLEKLEWMKGVEYE